MMGFFYWGEANNPNRSDNNEPRSERRKVRVSDLTYGHSPDKRGERTDKWGKAPIVVRRGRVVDGNDRLFYAKQRGDKYIEAEVWE